MWPWRSQAPRSVPIEALGYPGPDLMDDRPELLSILLRLLVALTGGLSSLLPHLFFLVITMGEKEQVDNGWIDRSEQLFLDGLCMESA